MIEDNELGKYLRSRRGAVTPAAAGFAPGQDRRVAGLRREEVALLAAVSTDYYRRLEQGRERHPSQQVLDALATALQLNTHESRHLHEIGQPVAAAVPESAASVSAALRILIDHSLTTPASVIGPALDVLATNALARALYSPFQRFDNIAKMVFLDPAARDFYADWDKVARSAVANLRATSTAYPAEMARISRVVGELSIASSTFAQLWAEHEVHPRTEEIKVFRHPQVGELHLHFEAMWISGAGGQRVYVYSPAPGSPSQDALTLLARTAGGLDTA